MPHLGRSPGWPARSGNFEIFSSLPRLLERFQRDGGKSFFFHHVKSQVTYPAGAIWIADPGSLPGGKIFDRSPGLCGRFWPLGKTHLGGSPGQPTRPVIF